VGIRKVWFITRPERDPKFHKEALLALHNASNGFSLKWTGNRDLHKAFEEELNKMGLKRKHISHDGSGGRTWAAMLRTFSYCYIDEDGYLVPTKVGLSILKGHKVYENIKKQILTLQIPNAYFLESGFRPKFDSSFAIRPALFLINLCNQPDLNFYLTKEEITYFALTAKKDSEINDAVEKIKTFRSADAELKKKIKLETAQIFDHRERSDKGARNYENAHSDVAHTFMLICDYTGLVEYIRGEALRIDPADTKKVEKELEFYKERYPFNKRYLISLQHMAENSGLDVDSYKASRYGDVKPAANRRKTDLKVQRLLQHFPEPSALSAQELQKILEKELPSKEAEKIASHLTEKAVSGLSSDFVEAYLNEQNNFAFEDKTGEIFKAIGFDVVMRPKPENSVQTEIEILLKYNGSRCGIIDAKNYREKFSLSAGLASHMASEYIPNYDGFEGSELNFFGYVTASSFAGHRNLEKISNLAKRMIPDREIKGVMLNARVLLGFLDYCIENDIPKDLRIKMFLSTIDNKAYSTPGKFLRAAQKGV